MWWLAFLMCSGWAKAYGGYATDILRCMHRASDSGYIVAGETCSYGAGSKDFSVIKLTLEGEVLWAKSFGGIDDESALCVQQTLDSGYIVSGYTQSYGPVGCNFLLIKLSPVGGLSWAKYYGGIDFDYGEFVQQTLDTGYIFVGGSESYGAGSSDFLVAKLDSLGKIEPCSVLVGCSLIVNSVSPDVYSVTPETSYHVILVVSCSPETSSTSLSVIDICPHGVEEKRFFAGARNDRLEIYPNPSRLGGTVIRYRIPELRSQRSEIRIQIYDLVGRVVKTFNHLPSRPFNQIVWDGRDENNRKVASGIYFCELQAEGSKRRKLIVLR